MRTVVLGTDNPIELLVEANGALLDLSDLVMAQVSLDSGRQFDTLAYPSIVQLTQETVTFQGLPAPGWMLRLFLGRALDLAPGVYQAEIRLFYEDTPMGELWQAFSLFVTAESTPGRYVTQANIEETYPGALAQAGPREADGELDPAAIAAALSYADSLLEERLGRRFPLPWMAPYPRWLVELAVDLALYRATPAVLIDTFRDRKSRHDAALARLDDIAAGRLEPPIALVSLADPPGQAVWVSTQPPRYPRGSLR